MYQIEGEKDMRNNQGKKITNLTNNIKSIIYDN